MLVLDDGKLLLDNTRSERSLGEWLLLACAAAVLFIAYRKQRCLAAA